MRALTPVTRAVTITVVMACSPDRIADSAGGPQPRPPVLNPVPGLTVSSPQSLPLTGAAPSPGRARANEADVFVSLVPGTVPAGTRAEVRNLATGVVRTTLVVGGGFDPVPLPAQIGDLVQVVVSDSLGARVLDGTVAVTAARRPIVVRTDPPPRRRDLPLNSAIIIVFSQPMDSASIASSVRLLRAGARVAATVALRAEPWIAELVPTSELDPATTYLLHVTQEATDLAGSRLDREVAIEFVTASGPIEPPAPVVGSLVIRYGAGRLGPLVGVVPGAQVELHAVTLDTAGIELPDWDHVTWESADTTVARVRQPYSPPSRFAMLDAVAPGTTTVTARTGGLTSTMSATVTAVSGGSVAVTIQDFRMIEFQYSPEGRYHYAPQVRVAVSGAAVHVLRMEFMMPPESTETMSVCAAAHWVAPGTASELFREVYGDYSITFDFNGGARVNARTVALKLYYVAQDGVRTVTATGPVVAGGLPTTYSGGIWDLSWWSTCR